VASARENAPLERIEVVEREEIVAHGTRRTEWYVHSGDGWLRAARAPKAITKTLDSGPGTVWQLCIELSLPVGARLLQVHISPRKEPAKDAFAHLLKGSRGAASRMDRIYYRVARRGELAVDTSNQE
jgi:hypothetical protein